MTREQAVERAGRIWLMAFESDTSGKRIAKIADEIERIECNAAREFVAEHNKCVADGVCKHTGCEHLGINGWCFQCRQQERP